MHSGLQSSHSKNQNLFAIFCFPSPVKILLRLKGPPLPQDIPIFAKNQIEDSITLIYSYYGATPEIGPADGRNDLTKSLSAHPSVPMSGPETFH